MDVQLYVYDLTQGLARQLSRQFLGTQIDAVYHTSIVLDGIEYFFGQGIQSCAAGSTHHGRPMEVVRMGRTELPIELVVEYLDSLRAVYTPESYDLFLHNCNNFSNDFSMFLVGKNIPDHITSLPQTVLNTPFGQMLQPYLDQAMRPITQAPLASRNAPQRPQPAKPKGAVRNITALSDLEQALSSASTSCAVVFFTSSTCAPCKILYPTYDALAAEAGSKATLIKVDTNAAPAIASAYSVRATPTIVTFLRGQKDEEWAGTDAVRLRTTVERLVRLAHPAHPHSRLATAALVDAGRRPVRYAKVPPLDKLLGVLGPAGQNPAASAARKFIAGLNSAIKQDNPLPDIPALMTWLDATLAESPAAKHFAAYDLLRALLIDARAATLFAEPRWSTQLAALFARVTKLGDAAPHNLRIVALHLACNATAVPAAHHLLRGEGGAGKELIDLATQGLLDAAHANVRVAAASLAFNVAAANHAVRVRAAAAADGAGPQVAPGAAAGEAGEEEPLAPDAQFELLAAAAEALGREKESKEAATGLVLGLGLLVHLAPAEGEVLYLARTLEVGALAKGKMRLFMDGEGVVQAVRLLEKGVGES